MLGLLRFKLVVFRIDLGNPHAASFVIPPAGLSPEQRPLYEDMCAGIGKSFHGFAAIREDGALMGPWNPWLHEARIGKPIWELTKALSEQSKLPDPARQIAILVTGAHFRAAYEIYAHVAIAEHDKLPDAKLATIVAGQRPPDLTRDEAIALSPPRSRAAVCCRN
jgi:hypothetical protein